MPRPGFDSHLMLYSNRRNALNALFEKLSAGANVTNPLSTTFFGAYGALNDRFGVRWMFAGNYAASKEG